MTQQLKNDIKTIIEVLTFIVISFGLSLIYTNTWGLILFSSLFVVRIIYKVYLVSTLRNRSEIMLIPTPNDEYAQMAPISFSVILLFFSVIGYFAFNLNVFYSIIGATIGIAVFLYGFFRPPVGWISIKNIDFEVYGIEGIVDTRQLKEITIKSDKITLTNIYGEHKNSNLLNLRPSVAKNIKKFLEERLPKSDILIVDRVTTTS
jgi:hypothetical protein